MASTVEVSCKWCECRFMTRTADRARGWAQCCSKACAASLKSFGHNKAYWEEKNPDNHLKASGCAGVLKRSNIQKYADRLFASAEECEDVDISDMDFGASDGGGYERFDGSPA